ncbi:hypothetical protein J6TS2_42430 [Heyndrickxia sporothermodurans]|nr:hypothetical protein J6TS2_42430 [Heyndrickxia sporothermodurans]
MSHELFKLYGLDKVKFDFHWIPRYGKDNGKPDKKPDFHCCLWQYSQSCKVSWYGGYLDLNLLNGDKTLEWFIGENASNPVDKPEAVNTGSIVDYMISKGMNSGYANRKKLATQYGLKSYTGTAAQNTTLLNRLYGGAVVSKPKGDQKTTSVVDYLKSIGQDFSYVNHAKLATKQGIKNYNGTAGQNAQLLNKLRK